jgi:membrane dipeptidase
LTYIADLHCDLLSYLSENDSHSPYDASSRCSLAQMRKGKKILQVLPIFVERERVFGIMQYKIFLYLSKTFAAFELLKNKNQLQHFLNWRKVHILLAIENASFLCDEVEPINKALERLHLMSHNNIVYISLTWNHENRFGGGCSTNIGLKEDGKTLLNFLEGRNIAIDLSHTSDALAYDIIDHLDKNGLKNIPIMASHSNVRDVCDNKRNLPDTLIQEIINRKGLIGINFFRPFIGDNDALDICHHVDKILSLGGDDSICFGTDFFYEGTHSLSIPMKYSNYGFLSVCENSGGYQRFLNHLKINIGMSHDIIKKMANENIIKFLDKILVE